MLEEDEKYFESNRFKRLLQRYETAMEQTGTIYLEPDELTDIAEYYAMQNRMDEANAAIDLATALHPDAVDPMVFLSRQQMFMGNMAEAHRLCEAIPEQQDREVFFLRAELMLNDNRHAEAMTYLMDIYQTLVDEDEPDLFLYDSAALLCDYAAWDEMLSVLNTLRAEYPPMPKAERLYIVALLESGQSADVIREADKYLEQNPYDIRVWVAKGEASAAMDDLEQGLDAAEYALAISPDDPHALVLAGNCTFHLGEYQRSLDFFTNYLQQYPEEGSAHYLRALCLSALEQYEESLREADLIDMESPTVDGMRDGIYLHQALTNAKLGDLQQALAYESLYEMETAGSDTNFDMQKGFIYLYVGDTEQASKHLQNALRRMPPLENAFDAPIQCIENGHVEVAIQLLLLMDEVYANDDQRERIAPMLAHCYYQTGDKPAFLRTFLRALIHEPELTANVFRIELPHTTDQEELLRSAYKQLFNGPNENQR